MDAFPVALGQLSTALPTQLETPKLPLELFKKRLFALLLDGTQMRCARLQRHADVPVGRFGAAVCWATRPVIP